MKVCTNGFARKLLDRTCERPPAASRLSPFVRGTMALLSPLQRGTAAKRQGVAHTFGLTVFAVINSQRRIQDRGAVNRPPHSSKNKSDASSDSACRSCPFQHR